MLAHPSLLPPKVLAQVLDQHAWATYNLGRFEEAAMAAGRAVAVREELDSKAELVGSLLVRSRMLS